MFGYVIVNKDELKFKEYDIYKRYYCGICNALKERSGLMGRMSLNYDAVFLALILTGLYGEESSCKKCRRCVVHPIKKHDYEIKPYITYSADMSIYLTYYKCIDDWKDDKKLFKYLYAKLISGQIKDIENKYPGKCQNIKNYLLELSEYEHNETYDIDLVSGCFGKITEEIYEYSDDVWQAGLRKIGFYLGKFIYILDAYDDIEKDIKYNSYNPLIERYNNAKSMKSFESECRNILLMMITECSREFEKLPIVENIGIIRNILYSGVWGRFNLISEKRQEK